MIIHSPISFVHFQIFCGLITSTKLASYSQNNFRTFPIRVFHCQVAVGHIVTFGATFMYAFSLRIDAKIECCHRASKCKRNAIEFELHSYQQRLIKKKLHQDGFVCTW